MERYHLDDEINTGKRTNLNKELYSKVYSSNRDFHTELVSIENSEVVDIMKVKELISSRETQNKENYITKITGSINTDIKNNKAEVEEELRKHDINTVLEQAKKDQKQESEKSKYRKLSDTIFLKLDEIKKEQEKQNIAPVKEIIEKEVEVLENEFILDKEKNALKEKINNVNTEVSKSLDNEEEKLTKIISKIAEKNEQKLSQTAQVSLDLLSNLAPSENSVVLTGVNTNIKSMLDTDDEVDNDDSYEETLVKTLYRPVENLGTQKNKTFEYDVDKTFYTKSMNFNRKDFDITSSPKKINKVLNFILFIIILLIIAILVFILLKFL